MTPARLYCLQCHNDLIDPDTPLHHLDPALAADLCRAHDYAEHGRFRADAAYDSVAATIAMLQAQHKETTP